jgi:integrase
MTGLREGELVAFRWLDVDWMATRSRVRQDHVLGEYGTPKSERATRSVPMGNLQEGMGHRDIQTTMRSPTLRRAHTSPT